MSFDILLTSHLVSGSITVIGMLVAFASRKGSRIHRLGGRVFTIAMCVALVTAIALAVRKSDIFIGLVAVFSAYFVYTGWRVAAIRDRRFLTSDRIALVLLMLASAAMFIVAVLMQRQGEGLFPVLLVFGALAIGLVATDWRYRGGWPKGIQGVTLHLTRMGGASIATITAVFVVNVRTDPEFIAWLVPSAVIIPTLLFFARRLKRSGEKCLEPKK